MKNKTPESNKSASEKMMDAISSFITRLNAVPGWREARVSNLLAAMDFDGISPESNNKVKPIELPHELDLQHAVVIRYLELCDLVLSIKACEYYFRRFPFRDLPVTRHEHLSNVCELYFSRIYQFKERLKYLVDAVDVLMPKHGIQFGQFINRFAKEFDQEIRERNQIHHFERFSDLNIERVYLAGMHDLVYPKKGWKASQRAHYRKVAKDWVQRVRSRGARLDDFLEAVAEVLLRCCPFLADCKQEFDR